MHIGTPGYMCMMMDIQAYYTFIYTKKFTTASFFNIALVMYIKSSYENYTLFSLTPDFLW